MGASDSGESVDTFEDNETVKIVVLGEWCGEGVWFCGFNEFGRVGGFDRFCGFGRFDSEKPSGDEEEKWEEIATLDAVDEWFAWFGPGDKHGGEHSEGNEKEDGDGEKFERFGDVGGLAGFLAEEDEDGEGGNEVGGGEG